MFFNRLIRNIFIFFLVFIITVNVYYWSIAITQGTQDNVQYTGFYVIFQNLEKFPGLSLLVDSINRLVEVFSDMSGWEKALAIITLGVSIVAKFCWYLTQIIVCLGLDLIRMFLWIFGFFGITSINMNWNIPLT